MTKILEIDICRSCPYLSTDMARNCWRCTQESRSIHMPDTDIPKWCPLENATGESDKVNLNDTIDAVIWTEEWMKTITEHTGIPTDEGTMIGWFSNAIMAGFDEGQRRMEKDKIEAIGWMYAQACSYVDEGIDIRKILVPDIMQAMEEDFLNAVEKEDDY